MPAFRTILVANRGEIACRIMRTAREMGYRTAAVYSEADADALHVRSADAAACIGRPEARASYLNIDAIIAAARRMGADAIHPGYGFLSENADFAQACVDEGLVFIGPPPAAIAAMGNKAAAKRRMLEAGVPCIPGYQGADQSDATLMREADRIGFPVMVKAAAGGGGRGMRLVADKAGFAAALSGARAEAESAFGSGELILEKAVADARHVEVQVLADTHGNIIHLGERDCSVQRRHQKVLEEAPSPAVDAELRARMGKAAVAAARAVGYTNAGTVEFLLGSDRAFYFLEMNTRLQVEHPVTEMVTGLDLVALQIRVAAGECLPIGQDDSPIFGHAIEARLYAEAPHKDFLPQPGRLSVWLPPSGPGVRVDHGLNASQDISPFYDPILAKIVATGATREEARRRLVQALGNTVALGTTTNRAFLLKALNHPEFVAGRATTNFIPSHLGAAAAPTPDSVQRALSAVLWFEASARRHGHNPALTWSSSGAIAWPLALSVEHGVIKCSVSVLGPGRYGVEVEGNPLEITIRPAGDGRVWFRAEGQEQRADFAVVDGVLFLRCGVADLAVREVLYDPPSSTDALGGSDTELRSPMNGKIVSVLVHEGDPVTKGQRLIVVEAMKMQHELAAVRDGTVASITVKQGDQVAARQVVATLQFDS
jgi:geranyl-CoA carboxylase alpha subunit